MNFSCTWFDWTTERIELVTRMWANGSSYSEIAAELGPQVTRNMVCSKVTRLNLPKRRDQTFSAPRPKRTRIERTVRRRDDGRLVTAVEEVVENDDAIDTATLDQIETEAAPEMFLGIPFARLKPGHCRYPRGTGADILFCGQPQKPDSSYCADCHRRCHTGFRKLNISEAEIMRRRAQGIANAKRAAERRAA